MNKNEFQKLVDENIHPDFYFEQRLKAKVMSAEPVPQKKRNSKKILISALSGALCLVLALGIFSFSYQSNKIAPGSVMIAGADALESNVDITYHYGVAVVDTRGKTKQEAGEEMLQKRNKLESAINLDTVVSTLGHRIDGSENVLFYSVQGDSFDIQVDKPEDVKKIRLQNDNPMLLLQYEFADGSTDEAEERFYEVNDDEYYTEVDNGGNDWYLLGKNGEKISLDEYIQVWFDGLHIGNQLTIDGERFAHAKTLEKNEELSNTCCIGIYARDEFVFDDVDGICEAIENDPSFQLTDITDRVTFEVEFKNGDVAKSIVNVTFNDDGFMVVSLDSYEYIEA